MVQTSVLPRACRLVSWLSAAPRREQREGAPREANRECRGSLGGGMGISNKYLHTFKRNARAPPGLGRDGLAVVEQELVGVRQLRQGDVDRRPGEG